MKIASYNMAQQAVHTFKREENVSFSSELIFVKGPDLDYSGFDEHEETEDETVETISKYELIDSLMAYLDRRKFDYKEIPLKEITKLQVCDDATVVKKVIEYKEPRNQIEIRRIKEMHEVFESESLNFTSAGQLVTENGDRFEFSYDVKMHREFYEKNTINIKQGMIDPLILNLDNKGVSFSDKKIHIDLDLDGKIDTFHMPNQENGFLVLDKNNNGKVDDGSELFGPQTSDGFGELRKYDEDNNHWIDENDVIFNNLKIWSLDKDGKETLVDIKESNIGAIYLGSVEGKFDYKTGNNTVARITDSSIFLKEDGSVSSIHEIQV